jgi:hypothetical protein
LNHFIVGEWQVLRDGLVHPLEATMPGWDPAVPIKAFISVTINTEEVIKECGLSDDAVLSLVPVWKSDGTVLRGIGERILIMSKSGLQEFVTNIYIEGLILAAWVELSINLVLLDMGGTNKPFAAKYPGSILFQSDPFRVYLQGEGARFPIEVIDFGNTQYPNDAAWALFWDPFNLHQTAHGDLRLYINSRHDRVREAVSTDKSDNRDIQETIRFDVARMLIEGALRNEEFVNSPETYSPDSIGFVIKNMLRNYFPNMDFCNLRDECLNTQTFEPKLQEKFRVFHKKD